MLVASLHGEKEQLSQRHYRHKKIQVWGEVKVPPNTIQTAQAAVNARYREETNRIFIQFVG